MAIEMTDSKFTHGPWIVSTPGYVSATYEHHDEPRPHPHGVAVTLGLDSEEDAANACLIAAAPDLFIALLAIETYILSEAGYEDRSFNKALRDVALEALTKAQGKQP